MCSRLASVGGRRDGADRAPSCPQVDDSGTLDLVSTSSRQLWSMMLQAWEDRRITSLQPAWLVECLTHHQGHPSALFACLHACNSPWSAAGKPGWMGDWSWLSFDMPAICRFRDPTPSSLTPGTAQGVAPVPRACMLQRLGRSKASRSVPHRMQVRQQLPPVACSCHHHGGSRPRAA